MFAEFISNEEEEFYMICPKCGSEMPDDSAFCTRCGASLHTGTQENQNSQGGPQQGNPQGTPYGYGNPQGNNGAYYGNPQMNNGDYRSVLLDRCSSDCSSHMFYHFTGCPYHQFC